MNLFKRHFTKLSVTRQLESFFAQQSIAVQERDIDKDNGTTSYFFNYQGGHFVGRIKTSDKFVEIIYPAFHSVDAEYIDVVRAACNRHNNYVDVITACYNYSDENDKINLHLTFYDNIADMEEFADRLQGCFYLQRKFIELCDDMIKNDGGNDSETDTNRHNRCTFLINQQEMTAHNINNTNNRFDLSQRFTLGEYIPRVYTLECTEFAELTISTPSSGVKNVRDHDEIAATDLLRLIVRDDAMGYKTNVATLVLAARKPDSTDYHYLSLTVTPAGIDDTSCYVRVTSSVVPTGLSKTDSLTDRKAYNTTMSVVLALDRMSTLKKEQEFKYMWEDAIIKLKAKEDLNEEQEFLASISLHNEGYNYYWGMRHFYQGRYYEALVHLENCYEIVRQQAADDEKKIDHFMAICYHLGFCYNEIGNNRTAFFYLHHVAESARIHYVQEYINTLANIGDVRTLGVIDNVQQQLDNIMEQNDEDEMPQHLVEFREFLLRRRGFMLIELGRLELAEQQFKALLDSPISHDYAVNELAYIQRLRREQTQEESSNADATLPDAK